MSFIIILRALSLVSLRTLGSLRSLGTRAKIKAPNLLPLLAYIKKENKPLDLSSLVAGVGLECRAVVLLLCVIIDEVAQSSFTWCANNRGDNHHHRATNAKVMHGGVAKGKGERWEAGKARFHKDSHLATKQLCCPALHIRQKKRTNLSTCPF